MDCQGWLFAGQLLSYGEGPITSFLEKEENENALPRANQDHCSQVARPATYEYTLYLKVPMHGGTGCRKESRLGALANRN